MIQITLTWTEVMMASQIGVMRHISALRKGLPDKHGFADVSGWHVHVEGACGELAAAKAMGRFWSGSVDTFKVGGDVGSIQVRTRSKQEYDLLVRPDDRDEDVFVLVCGASPSFVVHGWMRGRDAKVEKYAKRYGGRPMAYFVPKSELRAMGEMGVGEVVGKRAA